MAAQSTALADCYEPGLWNKYFLEQNTEKNLLIQSGIAAASPEVQDAVNQGGRTISMPFWDDLLHDTAATTRSKVATDDDTAITPAGIGTGKEIAVKHFRTQSWQAAPIVKYVIGQDPVQVFMNRYVNWWVREMQRLLMKTLYGCFEDATIKAALSHDISGETATTDPAKLVSTDAIETARFLLGDAYDKFTAIIMHSVVFKRLRMLDLIDDTPESAQVPNIPTYMGLRVLVDDSLTKVAGTTSGYRYYTYLFGSGAIALVDIPIQTGDPAIELYRQPLKGTGAGMVDVITRRYFILHPRGISYTGALAGSADMSPTDAELIADNWTQAYLTKNIRIARLITNG